MKYTPLNKETSRLQKVLEATSRTILVIRAFRSRIGKIDSGNLMLQNNALRGKSCSTSIIFIADGTFISLISAETNL